MKSWGVTGVLLALAAVAAGCASGDRPAPATTATPTSRPTATVAPTPSEDAVPAGIAVHGSGGLDVRYLQPDGTTKTLRVEDFRR